MEAPLTDQIKIKHMQVITQNEIGTWTIKFDDRPLSRSWQYLETDDEFNFTNNLVGPVGDHKVARIYVAPVRGYVAPVRGREQGPHIALGEDNDHDGKKYVIEVDGVENRRGYCEMKNGLDGEILDRYNYGFLRYLAEWSVFELDWSDG